MMEWETGKHMCNKHEMNMQVLLKKKNLSETLLMSEKLVQSSLEHYTLFLNSLSLPVETTWQ